MGRTQPSVVRPPAAFRRDARAKKAKATINKLIPSLLSAHPRARRGIEASELIVPPPATSSQPSKTSATSPPPASAARSTGRPPRLTIRTTDTLTAAHALLGTPGKVALLNMASPLSPGGGFLNGATSQEEFLCMRTTLLPALRDDFYRLPELGCVCTPDVLVFRASADGDHDMLDKRDRWFVDVVSAAMLRLPETEVDEGTGRGRYVHAKDRELAVDKMRAVMRATQTMGAAKIVLGAWGCGAYGNPVGEVARAWRKVLLGERSNKGKRRGKTVDSEEHWDGVDEVLFAVRDSSMAEAFKTAFGDDLEWADEADDGEYDDEEEGSGEAAEADELSERIRELRLRIQRAPDPRVRGGLEAVLTGLESQRPKVLGGERSGSEDG